MMSYDVNKLIESFEKDSEKNAKRKPTNQLVIDMLENSGLEIIKCNPTKSLSVANRGEVVEITLKKVVCDYLGLNRDSSKLSACYTLDLDLRKVENAKGLEELGLLKSCYEIKFCSSIANATTIQRQDCKKVLIVNGVASLGIGVYLVDKDKLILNNSNHVTAKSIANGVKLDLLSELLLG